MTNPTSTTAEKLAREIAQLSGQYWVSIRDAEYEWFEKELVPILQRALNETIELEIAHANRRVEAAEYQRDDLRAKLQPSPCGVEGHRMVDFVEDSREVLPATTGMALEGARVTGRCLACQRREQVKG